MTVAEADKPRSEGAQRPTQPGRREARRQAIEDAAYAVLAKEGYKAASMLAIAREAKASNETLYRWYGNKQGLFGSLVERNAETAREMLDAALSSKDTPLLVLETLGPVLLRLVTSERAVALNRAAAGDVHDTATLGAALAAGGRQALKPRIAALLAQANEVDVLRVPDPGEAADIYISLLIGDLQIRRVTGALDALSRAEIATRSERAMRLVRQLYAA